MKKLKSHAIAWAQIERFREWGQEARFRPKILAFDEEACLQQAFGER
jgi:hypothetical protein